MAECIFCGDSPTTQTHIFRKAWLNRIFSSDQKFSHHIWRDGEHGFDHEFDRDEFSDAPKCSCGRCNGQWMHAIEHAGEPLIEQCAVAGASRTFNASEQVVLARWLTVVAFVAEQSAE